MRNERKNAVRQAIVDTASRLFYKQGYGNTGINQIIEESGVVKSSLYTSFRSKEDILMAYLESSGAATDAALKGATDKFTDPKKEYWPFSIIWLTWCRRKNITVVIF